MLKMSIPAHANDEGFKIVADGEDITDKINVKKIHIIADAGEVTKCSMEVYIDEVEVDIPHDQIDIDKVLLLVKDRLTNSSHFEVVHLIDRVKGGDHS